MPRCYECQTEVEPDAKTCPHCGYNPAKKDRIARMAIWWLGILLMFSVIGFPVGWWLTKKAEQRKTELEEMPVTQSS